MVDIQRVKLTVERDCYVDENRLWYVFEIDRSRRRERRSVLRWQDGAHCRANENNPDLEFHPWEDL